MPIEVAYGVAGRNVYAMLIAAQDDTFWNGSGTEAYQTAHRAAYATALTQLGTASGIYSTNTPSGLPVGDWSITFWDRVGSNPAEGDSFVGGVRAHWDGANWTVLDNNAIADATLRRHTANVEGSSNGDALDLHSLYGMIRQAQKSGPISGTSLPVYKTDGTLLGTLALVEDTHAKPITGIS